MMISTPPPTAHVRHVRHIEHEHAEHERHLARLAALRTEWQPPRDSQETSQLAPLPAMGAGPSAMPVLQSAVPPGSFQQCVIARESGGDSQVMNSSQHYGLYQFSAPTWAAYGGNPADFGHASVAEQNAVFANAMATPGGAGNWTPWDGCQP